MKMTTLQKVTFCILFFPGYFLVFMSSFTRQKGQIRAAQKGYREIHFYGPFYAMIIYISFFLFFLSLLSPPTAIPEVEIDSKSEATQTTEIS